MFGQVVQIFQEQQSNKGCPNLNTKGIFACADKRFHFQVLLEGLEKYFYLPPVFVNCGDCACAEIKVIRQEDYLPQLHFIPNNDASKQMRTFILGFYPGESNKLVSKD